MKDLNRTISTLPREVLKENIYIITQPEKQDEALVIHSFSKPERYLNLLIHKKIQIVTDKLAELSLLKKIKTLMYDFIQDAILNSNASDVFWYRIAGSLIFGFFLFLFATFIIPDPIPYIDELAISCLGGFLFYFMSVKLKLFYFVSSKKMEEYIRYIDNIQVIDSKSLNELNIIFNDFYKKLVLKDFYKTNVEDDLKKEIKRFSTDELIEIREVISILSNNYSFKHIKEHSKKFYKKAKSSLLSQERFNFYYLLYKILFK